MQIEDIKKLNIEPGDIIVLRFQQVISHKQRDSMLGDLKGVLGAGVRVLILDGGISIDVFSQTDCEHKDAKS